MDFSIVETILIIVFSALAVSVIFHAMRFPVLLGYLLVGTLVGPHVLAWVPDPEPLKELHDSIRKLFTDRDGEAITSRDIVDVMNLIGKTVVAGNVRRTAEIALGDINDDSF